MKDKFPYGRAEGPMLALPACLLPALRLSRDALGQPGKYVTGLAKQSFNKFLMRAYRDIRLIKMKIRRQKKSEQGP